MYSYYSGVGQLWLYSKEASQFILCVVHNFIAIRKCYRLWHRDCMGIREAHRPKNPPKMATLEFSGKNQKSDHFFFLHI